MSRLGWTKPAHSDRAFRAAQDAQRTYEYATRHAVKRECKDALFSLMRGATHEGAAINNYSAAGKVAKKAQRELTLHRDDAQEAYLAYCVVGGDASKLPDRGWRLPLRGVRRRRKRR